MAKAKHVSKQVLIDILSSLAQIYRILGDKYRADALVTASINIKRYFPDQVHAIDTAPAGMGIGKGILGRINEIVQSGSLAELKKLEADPKIRTYRLFEGIYGIGPKTAMKFVQKGYTKLSQVRKHMKNSVGIDYYREFNTRFDRSEAAKLEKYIKQSMKNSMKKQKIKTGSDWIIAGSYRRGLKSVGDIDILTSSKRIYKALLDILQDGEHVLLNSGSTRTSLLAKLPFFSCHHVIDIRYIAKRSIGAAMLYFTGPKQYNVIMRQWAKSKGYILNEYGLFTRTGRFVAGKTEAEVYKALGLKFQKPTDRFYNIFEL